MHHVRGSSRLGGLKMEEVAEMWRSLGREQMAMDENPRHEAVHAELRLKVPAALEHTGTAAFDSHLLGVQVGSTLPFSAF